MKLRSLLCACGALVLGVLIACDAGDSIDATHRNGGQERDESRAFGGTDARLGEVRDRADAAFAEMAQDGPGSSPGQRFETRIGPQPWPADLPENWPRPSNGRVVADSRRAEGDRLLLVDWPIEPADASLQYEEALRDQGYEISDAPTQGSLHGIHARRGRDEAFVRFFRRDEKTRIEILFVEQGRG